MHSFIRFPAFEHDNVSLIRVSGVRWDKPYYCKAARRPYLLAVLSTDLSDKIVCTTPNASPAYPRSVVTLFAHRALQARPRLSSLKTVSSALSYACNKINQDSLSIVAETTGMKAEDIKVKHEDFHSKENLVKASAEECSGPVLTEAQLAEARAIFGEALGTHILYCLCEALCSFLSLFIYCCVMLVTSSAMSLV